MRASVHQHARTTPGKPEKVKAPTAAFASPVGRSLCAAGGVTDAPLEFSRLIHRLASSVLSPSLTR